MDALRPGRGSRDLWNLPQTPLIWLERARGWRRLALGVIYVIVVAVAGVLTWRAFSLYDLPDVGDPFDVSEFDQFSVPDERNAYVLYREAEKALGRINANYTPEDWNNFDEEETDWRLASAMMKRWVLENRETLRLVIEGAGRPESLGPSPRSLTDSKPNPMLLSSRGFFVLLTLEGSRRFHDGDLAGAWEAYRALLRLSRHLEFGNESLCRLVVCEGVTRAMGNMKLWMLDPGVTPSMLRGAIEDVRAAEALTPPASQAVKINYMMMQNRLAEPGLREEMIRGFRSNRYEALSHLPGTAEVAWFMSREPERSLRIVRLYYANWLSQCDRPAGSRARCLMGGMVEYPMYQTGRGDPASARAIRPQALNDWIESSLVGHWELPNMAIYQSIIDADQRQIVTLREFLEERLEELESKPAR